jgi:hypothetical protein
MSGDEELLDTIEQIRQDKFPEVPAELVKEIALIEANYTENRQEAYRRIAQAVDAYLQKQAAAKDAGAN